MTQANTSADWDVFWGDKKSTLYIRLKRSLTSSLIRRLQRETGPILEAGCGEGALPAAIDGIGLDFSRTACKVANERASVVRGDLYAMPFKPVFGVVCNQSVVQAQDDPLNAVRSMLRVVRPGGKALFTVPRKYGMFHVMYALRSVLPMKWPSKELFWSGREIRQLFSSLGEVEVTSLWYGQLLLVSVKKEGV